MNYRGQPYWNILIERKFSNSNNQKIEFSVQIIQVYIVKEINESKSIDNVVPDFMSTRSTLPCLENKRSSSDCRVSYSKFPTKTGLIVATVPQITAKETIWKTQIREQTTEKKRKTEEQTHEHRKRQRKINWRLKIKGNVEDSKNLQKSYLKGRSREKLANPRAGKG